MAYDKLTIKLNEIPADGDSWSFSNETKDGMSEYLDPELDISNYSIDISIRPMGNVFEAQVDYTVSHELLCSKCAYEFKLPIKKTSKEMLVVRQKAERIEKQKSTSKNWNDDLFCTELDRPTIHLGDFIREIILIDAPTRPLGFGELCETEACEPIKSAKFTSGNIEKWPEDQKNKPFSVLENLIQDKNKAKQ